MKEIEKKIKDLGFDNWAVTKGGHILLFKGYSYYKERDRANFSVSPYYFASNASYFAAKELVQYIVDLGCRAELLNHEIYDDMLEEAGLIRGKNNLFFSKDLGSLFCVQLIGTDAPMEERNIEGVKCRECGRCIKACPMAALTGEGIVAELCLRERMDKTGDEISRDKITTLLGCDICQKVCPNNSRNTEDCTYPQFNREKIISGDMDGIAQLAGKNMARKKRLQYQGMCIAANLDDKDCIKAIEAVSDETLEMTKNWCLERLKRC